MKSRPSGKRMASVLFGVLIGIVLATVFIALYNGENIGEKLLSWDLPITLLIVGVVVFFFIDRKKNDAKEG